jgi:hypothetical protein
MAASTYDIHHADLFLVDLRLGANIFSGSLPVEYGNLEKLGMLMLLSYFAMITSALLTPNVRNFDPGHESKSNRTDSDPLWEFNQSR